MTNTSEGKTEEKKDEIISARKKIEKCKKISDKDEQINCMYETLHNITEAQDIVNLTIYKVINDDEDPRWIPTLMADNANAILLGISRAKGNPQQMVRSGGYVEEKMNSLTDKWYSLRIRYKDD
jgi:hypothetical protein